MASNDAVSSEVGHMTNALLQEISEGIREIIGILQVAYGNTIKERLEEYLADDKRKLVYHYTDGIRSTRMLGRIADVSDKSVRDWWKEWFEAGIVEPVNVEGRYRRKYDLVKFGINVPRIKDIGTQDA